MGADTLTSFTELFILSPVVRAGCEGDCGPGAGLGWTRPWPHESFLTPKTKSLSLASKWGEWRGPFFMDCVLMQQRDPPTKAALPLLTPTPPYTHTQTD